MTIVENGGKKVFTSDAYIPMYFRLDIVYNIDYQSSYKDYHG